MTDQDASPPEKQSSKSSTPSNIEINIESTSKNTKRSASNISLREMKTFKDIVQDHGRHFDRDHSESQVRLLLSQSTLNDIKSPGDPKLQKRRTSNITEFSNTSNIRERRQREVQEAYEYYLNSIHGKSLRSLVEPQVEQTFGEKIISSNAFLGTVYAAIFVNAIQLGVQLDYPQHTDVYAVLDGLCNCVFVGELITKVVIMRLEYFKKGWNLFDFGLVVQALIDNLADTGGVGKNMSILRSLRMLRVVRVLRLLKVFRELWLIIQGLVQSFKPIAWVVCLLLMLIYMSAIFITMNFQDGREEYPGHLPLEEMDDWILVSAFNPAQYFGGVVNSMFSLFNLLILAEWAEFSWAIFMKQPYLLLFFINFILFTTFGVMNILISIIVENTIESADKLKTDVEMLDGARKLSILNQLRTIIETFDEGEDGISEEQLEEAMKDDVFCGMLTAVGFPERFSATELFNLLNTSGQEQLSVDQFLRNSLRLVSCERNKMEFQCLVLAGINQVLNDLRRVRSSQELAGAFMTSVATSSSTSPEFVMASMEYNAAIAQEKNGHNDSKKSNGGCSVVTTDGERDCCWQMRVENAKLHAENIALREEIVKLRESTSERRAQSHEHSTL